MWDWWFIEEEDFWDEDYDLEDEDAWFDGDEWEVLEEEWWEEDDP